MCHVSCLTNFPYNSVSLAAINPHLFSLWFLLLPAFAHGVSRDFYFAIGIALYYGVLCVLYIFH